MMDRHICGACKEEINDLDEFILHKRQTCKVLYGQKDSKAQVTVPPLTLSSANSADIPGGTEINVIEGESANLREETECLSEQTINNSEALTQLNKPKEPINLSTQNSEGLVSPIDKLKDCIESEETHFISTYGESAKELINSKASSLLPEKLSDIVHPVITQCSNSLPLYQTNTTNLQVISDAIDHCLDSTIHQSVVCTPPPGHEYIQTTVRTTETEVITPIQGYSQDATGYHPPIDRRTPLTGLSEKTIEQLQSYGDRQSLDQPKSLHMVLDHNGSYSLLSKTQVAESLQAKEQLNESLLMRVQAVSTQPNEPLLTRAPTDSSPPIHPPQTRVPTEVMQPNESLLKTAHPNPALQKESLLKKAPTNPTGLEQVQTFIHKNKLYAVRSVPQKSDNTNLSTKKTIPINTHQVSHNKQPHQSLLNESVIGDPSLLMYNNPELVCPLESQRSQLDTITRRLSFDENRTYQGQRNENNALLMQTPEVPTKKLVKRSLSIGNYPPILKSHRTPDKPMQLATQREVRESSNLVVSSETSQNQLVQAQRNLDYALTHSSKQGDSKEAKVAAGGSKVQKTEKKVSKDKVGISLLNPRDIIKLKKKQFQQKSKETTKSIPSETVNVISNNNVADYLKDGASWYKAVPDNECRNNLHISSIHETEKINTSDRLLFEPNSPNILANSATISSTTREGTSGVEIQQEMTKKHGQDQHAGDQSGIQYVLHTTPERNYFLPINNSLSEEEPSPPATTQTGNNLQAEVNKLTSTDKYEYTVHIQYQSADGRPTIEGDPGKSSDSSRKSHLIDDMLRPGLAGQFTDKEKTKKGTGSSQKDKEKKHVCTYENCTYSSFYAKDLIRHTRTHTGERPYQCGMCSKTFSRADKLRLHIRGHSGVKPYQCDQCDYRAIDSSTLKKHAMIHTNECPYKCQLCRYKCKTSSQLTVHLRTHTGDCPFTCPYNDCGAKFKIKTDLKRHYLTHTGERPYSCTECDARCTTTGNLLAHMKIHHAPNKQRKCNHCEFTTSSKRALRDHLKLHDPIDLETTCQICGLKCADSELLKKHMTVHKYDSFKCSHCDFDTRYQTSLEQHIKRKHSEHYHENKGSSSNRPGYHSSYRIRDTSLRRSSRKEKMYRKFKRPYKCDKCDESFVRKDSLNSHRRLHAELERNDSHLTVNVPKLSSIKHYKPVSSTITRETSDEVAETGENNHLNSSHYKGEFILSRQMESESITGDSYYRHESVQTSSVEETHRRQLSCDASSASYAGATTGIPLSNQRPSELTSQIHKEIHHNRRHTFPHTPDHSPTKRNKMDGGRHRSTNKSVKALLGEQRQSKPSIQSYNENTIIPNTLRNTIPIFDNPLPTEVNKHLQEDLAIGNNTSIIEISENSRPDQISTQPERLILSESSTLSQQVVKSSNSVKSADPTRLVQVQVPVHQQPIYQIPNIQLVQNISLPLLQLPDGQIIRPHLGNQMFQDVCVEQPNTDNIQPVQIVAPPGVEMLSPPSNAHSSLQNIALPSGFEMIDQLGNPIQTQFLLPNSLSTVEDPMLATVQNVDISHMPGHDQGGAIEQMMSPQHVITIPIHVVDMTPKT